MIGFINIKTHNLRGKIFQQGWVKYLYFMNSFSQKDTLANIFQRRVTSTSREMLWTTAAPLRSQPMQRNDTAATWNF